MLKQDKNGFLDIIRAEEFDPQQFEVFEEQREGSWAFIIHFKGTPLEFWTRNSSDSYREYDRSYVMFSPEFNSASYWPDENWSSSILPIYEEFRGWLKNHVRLYLEELTIPDLWSQIQDEQNVFGTLLSDEQDYRFFTSDEKKVLCEAIPQLRIRIIQEFSPTEDQLTIIDSKLDYLTGAFERLNRFDWKALLLSTLIGIATTMSFDSNSGRTLFEIGKHIFAGAIQLIESAKLG